MELLELAKEVASCIQAWGPKTDEEFLSLAQAIAEAQGRLLCEPVPEGAFKLMSVACFPPSKAEAVFLSSGTTGATRSRHLIHDLALYRLSAMAGFRHFCLYPPMPRQVITLIPEASKRPQSSLSHMVSFILEEGWERPPVIGREGERLALEKVESALLLAHSSDLPVLLLGTTLDFLALFEGLSVPCPLPPGSRIMHTGGAKARGKEVDRQEFIAQVGEYLGIPPDDVVEEYGMTELLSQAYDAPRVSGGKRRFVPVPWMRSKVLDPRTMEEVALGEEGLLCHHDLANVYTAVAILTEDLAVRAEDGFFSVRRAPTASPRGCSQEAAES